MRQPTAVSNVLIAACPRRTMSQQDWAELRAFAAKQRVVLDEHSVGALVSALEQHKERLRERARNVRTKAARLIEAARRIERAAGSSHPLRRHT